MDRNHGTDLAGLHPEAGLAGKRTLAHGWGPGQWGPQDPVMPFPLGLLPHGTAMSCWCPPERPSFSPNSRRVDKASRSQDEKMKQVLGTLTSMPLRGFLKQEPRLRFFQEEDSHNT